jgi:hypothetical protein
VSPLDSSNPQGVVVQKPRSDVYTTMLFLSLLAILIACLCLWLEMRAYNMDIKATEAKVASASFSLHQMTNVECRMTKEPQVSTFVI